MNDPITGQKWTPIITGQKWPLAHHLPVNNDPLYHRPIMTPHEEEPCL